RLEREQPLLDRRQVLAGRGEEDLQQLGIVPLHGHLPSRRTDAVPSAVSKTTRSPAVPSTCSSSIRIACALRNSRASATFCAQSGFGRSQSAFITHAPPKYFPR